MRKIKINYAIIFYFKYYGKTPCSLGALATSDDFLKRILKVFLVKKGINFVEKLVV